MSRYSIVAGTLSCPEGDICGQPSEASAGSAESGPCTKRFGRAIGQGVLTCPDVCPALGKAPPDIQIWTIGGEATTYARERGPLYPEGPMMTIQLLSPTWPDTPEPGR